MELDEWLKLHPETLPVIEEINSKCEKFAEDIRSKYRIGDKSLVEGIVFKFLEKKFRIYWNE